LISSGIVPPVVAPFSVEFARMFVDNTGNFRVNASTGAFTLFEGDDAGE
jgi:hypothetical protein